MRGHKVRSVRARSDFILQIIVSTSSCLLDVCVRASTGHEEVLHIWTLLKAGGDEITHNSILLAGIRNANLFAAFVANTENLCCSSECRRSLANVSSSYNVEQLSQPPIVRPSTFARRLPPRPVPAESLIRIGKSFGGIAPNKTYMIGKRRDDCRVHRTIVGG